MTPPVQTLPFHRDYLFIQAYLDIYAKIFKKVYGKSKLRCAFIGSYDRVLSSSEAITDFGIEFKAFSIPEVSPFYPNTRLEDLQLSQFDLIIIGGKTADDELRALEEFYQKVPHARERRVPIYLCHRILSSTETAMQALPDLRTCLGPRKIAVIAQMLAVTPKAGKVLECGAFRGGNTVFMALLLKQWKEARRIVALDSFAGMPAATTKDGETVYQQGFFASSYDEYCAFLKDAQVEDAIDTYRGFFDQTLPKAVSDSDQVSFALIDTDQYLGTHQALLVLMPKLMCNGIIVIDDYSCIGVRTAVDEMFMRHPSARGMLVTENFYMVWNQTDNNFLSAAV
jgi:predicted O-methyltransferase YrrM